MDEMALRIEFFGFPFSDRAFAVEKQAVMHAVALALPKFDLKRDESIAAPAARSGDGLAAEFFLGVLKSLGKKRARSQCARLL